MLTEIVIFDVNNATKNDKKILTFGTYKKLGVCHGE